MINVNELISERKEYAFGAKTTPWRDSLLARIIDEETSDNIAFITIGSTLFEKRIVVALQKKYHIVGAFKIGCIFTNTSIPFYIVQLSKTPSPEFKTALFNSNCYNGRSSISMDGGLITPNNYTEEWYSYIKALTEWMDGGSVPQSNSKYEFTSVPINQLYQDSFAPETYSKENIELRELMDKQDTRVLSDLAQILSPFVLDKCTKKEKVLTVHNFNYPIDVENLAKETPTNVVLQKGDVVIPKFKSKTNAFLFDYDGGETIFASRNLVVIRCNAILPEYLYLYLISDIAVKVLNARYVGSNIPIITSKEIGSLPIACPTQANQKYISDFHTLTHFGIRSYDQLQRIGDYFAQLTKIENKEEKPKKVEDILNVELANHIKAYREDQLRSFLSDDLKELNTCFRGKAYKATLILAGSILEAVLIDWISELHQRNYFEEEYIIKDKYGREKRADLIDYINEIKYIRRPRWADEAAKAHEIRKKRNLVHAKLCLMSDDINEQVCREVISYLRDVLKTRGVDTRE